MTDPLYTFNGKYYYERIEYQFLRCRGVVLSVANMRRPHSSRQWAVGRIGTIYCRPLFRRISCKEKCKGRMLNYNIAFCKGAACVDRGMYQFVTILSRIERYDIFYRLAVLSREVGRRLRWVRIIGRNGVCFIRSQFGSM